MQSLWRPRVKPLENDHFCSAVVSKNPWLPDLLASIWVESYLLSNWTKQVITSPRTMLGCLIFSHVSVSIVCCSALSRTSMEKKEREIFVHSVLIEMYFGSSYYTRGHVKMQSSGSNQQESNVLIEFISHSKCAVFVINVHIKMCFWLLGSQVLKYTSSKICNHH